MSYVTDSTRGRTKRASPMPRKRKTATVGTAQEEARKQTRQGIMRSEDVPRKAGGNGVTIQVLGIITRDGSVFAGLSAADAIRLSSVSKEMRGFSRAWVEQNVYFRFPIRGEMASFPTPKRAVISYKYWGRGDAAKSVAQNWMRTRCARRAPDAPGNASFDPEEDRYESALAYRESLESVLPSVTHLKIPGNLSGLLTPPERFSGLVHVEDYHARLPEHAVAVAGEISAISPLPNLRSLNLSRVRMKPEYVHGLARVVLHANTALFVVPPLPDTLKQLTVIAKSADTCFSFHRESLPGSLVTLRVLNGAPEPPTHALPSNIEEVVLKFGEVGKSLRSRWVCLFGFTPHLMRLHVNFPLSEAILSRLPPGLESITCAVEGRMPDAVQFGESIRTVKFLKAPGLERLPAMPRLRGFTIVRYTDRSDHDFPFHALPAGLTKLDIPGAANWGSRGDTLRELRSLRLGGTFNARLGPLPGHLEKLVLGTSFDHELPSPLPEGLLTLEIHGFFNFVLGALPPRLVRLSLPMCYTKPLPELPRSLRFLIIYNHDYSWDTPEWVESVRVGQRYLKPGRNLEKARE